MENGKNLGWYNNQSLVQHLAPLPYLELPSLKAKLWLQVGGCSVPPPHGSIPVRNYNLCDMWYAAKASTHITKPAAEDMWNVLPR